MTQNEEEEGQRLLENGNTARAEKPSIKITDRRTLTHIASFAASHISRLRPSSSTIRQTGKFLTPSFLQPRFFPDPADTQRVPERIFKTAYLDGLRGIASLFVYVFHSSTMMYKGTLIGFGQGTQGKNYYIFQLPILRLPFNGSAMVSIFFVISGFALSIAPLKYIRSNDPDQSPLVRSLSSAVFRRPIRLFVPPLLSTVIPFIMLRLGVYEATKPIVATPGLISGPTFFVLQRHDSFWAEFQDWLAQFWSLVQVCHDNSIEDFEPADRYNSATWTIPVEFGASLFLYLTHLGTSQLKTGVRMGLILLFIFIAFCSHMWVMILFWGGFLIAELDSILVAREAKGLSHLSSRGWKIFFWVNFVCGLYVASYPYQRGPTTPGYVWISMLIPKSWSPLHRFWEVIGSLQIMLSISRLPPLINMLSIPSIRYLGHISYPLYLVHWPIVQTYGVFIFGFVYSIIGKSGDVDTFLGWFISFIFISIIVLWATDLFWRVVDQPCIKFGKWLEGKCSKQN